MKKQVIYTGIKVVVGFYFLILSVQLPAQVCSGNYKGVSRQTFGKGPNPGGSLPPGRTSYQYTTSPCPTEGQYTIVNSVSGCGANVWDSVLTNNTPGDTLGYMMLINAAVTPGLVYVDTIRDLCGNSNYGFSVAVQSLSLPGSCGGHPLRPRFTFSAEDMSGTVLGRYQSGDITETEKTGGVYIYTVNFRMPSAGGAVAIKISDDAPGGCGNDFTLDNIDFSICGPEVTPGFVNSLGAVLDVCIGDAAAAPRLTAKVGTGYNNPVYQWQMYNGTDWVDIYGATNTQYGVPPFTAAGTYKYRLLTAEQGNIDYNNCRIASDELVVNVHNPSVAGTATNNGPVCINSPVHLIARGGRNYQWSGPGGFSAAGDSVSFKASHSSAGQYIVIIGDSSGCRSSASTTVGLLPPPLISISNTQTICKGDAVSLLAGGGTVYAWLPVNNLSNPAINNPVAQPALSTRYTVTITDNNNCSDTASVLVVVNTTPIVSAGGDKVILKGQSVPLDGSIKDLNNVNFSWVASPSLSNTHILNPVANPVVATDYILTASSTLGCGIAADTVSVKVYKEFSIPNVFTPNGDGHNDVWHIPVLQAFPNAVVTVYNRYGEKIFEGKAGHSDWDGTYKQTPQPTGGYVYVIDLKNNNPVIKGTVLIVR